MKEENAREGRRGSRSRAREVRNNSHLLSRRKEGGEGISGDARRKRLTAPWIPNNYRNYRWIHYNFGGGGTIAMQRYDQGWAKIFHTLFK